MAFSKPRLVSVIALPLRAITSHSGIGAVEVEMEMLKVERIARTLDRSDLTRAVDRHFATSLIDGKRYVEHMFGEREAG